MAVQSDPRSVGRHDEEHLRRFLRARADRDVDGMRRWWGELVIDFKDRMDGLVAAAHKGRLDADEHELAVQLAMIRFAQKLVGTFHGTSMGELVNATKQLATFAAIDAQDQSIAARRLQAVSLDDGWNTDGDERPAGSGWEVDAATGRLEAEESERTVEDFLSWALPQVIESRRRVLELTFEGAELAEICAELDLSDANAYQRRSRGLTDLRKLKEQYDA